ncbi:hypothetical protein ACIRSF_33510 [Streptomyces rubiginosohelvolus]|uniref:hypothetical protein n=1 Tax=Streptomyces rubiginosohelvolus TaxID=67362 RepID=UPI0038284485
MAACADTAVPPSTQQALRVAGSKLTVPVVMSSVGGLAEDNTVVGLAASEDGQKAFPVVWPVREAVERLAVSEKSTNASALAISGNGDVAGMYMSQELPMGPVRWAPSESAAVPVEMETLGGALTLVRGMNAQGAAVGSSQTQKQEVPHAVRWDRSGAVTDLGVLPGFDVSGAFGINDKGVVVGQSGVTDRVGRPVRWDPDGTLTELALPAGTRSGTANAVNHAGAVVGMAGPERALGALADPGDTDVQAVLWKPDGTVHPLPAPGGAACEAWDINRSGDVVGAFLRPGGSMRAVRWSRDGAPVELRPLQGDTVSSARAVNDRGYVAGDSMDDEGRTRAVLWHPDGSVTALDRHIVPSRPAPRD